MRSVKASRPIARRKVSGSWPAGSSATFTRKAPAPSNAPDRFSAAAILAADAEALRNQLLLPDLLRLDEREQRLPALGRVADSDVSRDAGVDPPLLKISARPLAGRLPERVGVEPAREIHHPQELLSARVAALRAALVGQRDPDALCQGPDGLGERETILAHHEAEGVAADPAAEAVEEDRK